ncbi:hypothetical protein GCM10009602_27050 [Nocardiopsis tropica]
MKTRAEAVPNRKRSYHSTVVPMTLAVAILFIFAGARRSRPAAAGSAPTGGVGLAVMEVSG